MDSNIQIPFIWTTDRPISDLWNAACCDPDFITANDLNPLSTTDDEREARAIVFQTPSAPIKPTTPGAANAVRRLLQRYDFSMADESARLRTYAISRLLDLAESEKENIALGAIEKIGKIAEVGLFETKISIDINKKPTEELEKDLQGLLSKYMDNLKVVNSDV
jgi:hypothetical protein